MVSQFLLSSELNQGLMHQGLEATPLLQLKEASTPNPYEFKRCS